MVHRRSWSSGILAPLILSACAAPAPTASPGSAGLVVVHGDSSVQTACVAFEEGSIRGEEVLARSGLGAVLDPSNPMGSLVCSIGDEGCAYPAQPCLCACDTPGRCAYWAYFHRDPRAGWVYSAQGAHMREVHSGDLDAWVWLLSSSAADSAAAAEVLAGYRFEDVCPAR